MFSPLDVIVVTQPQYLNEISKLASNVPATPINWYGVPVLRAWPLTHRFFGLVVSLVGKSLFTRHLTIVLIVCFYHCYFPRYVELIVDRYEAFLFKQFSINRRYFPGIDIQVKINSVIVKTSEYFRQFIQ